MSEYGDNQETVHVKNIVVGTDDFETLIKWNGYFVDKTRFIPQFLRWSQVKLITRPRRFGKTMTLSMLRHFFEMNYLDPQDRSRQMRLFSGLDIMKNEGFVRKNMGSWPVIFITFKGIEGLNFDAAVHELFATMQFVCNNFAFLLDSQKVSLLAKNILKKIIQMDENDADEQILLLKKAVFALEEALFSFCGQQVIVLIDEYDVPLMKARENGYYDHMLDLIRVMLGRALKTSPYVAGAVLMGCLRISKESVFTGMNNFTSYSISSEALSGVIGFTQDEADKVLCDFQLEDCREQAKAYYDGYRFGSTEMYCPWDLLSFCAATIEAGRPQFENFWINTSSNNLILEFVKFADDEHLEKLHALINGETVSANIDEDMSFAELNLRHSAAQLMSLLYHTGYLTKVGECEEGAVLRIPNKEVQECFRRQIEAFFSASNQDFFKDGSKLFSGLMSGNANVVEGLLTWYLKRFISIRDIGAESHYHGFLLGMLAAGRPDQWRGDIESNQEAGSGYADITIADAETSTAVVIELKKAERSSDAALEAMRRTALEQVESRGYAEKFRRYRTIYLYGIAFSAKTCAVEMRRTTGTEAF